MAALTDHFNLQLTGSGGEAAAAHADAAHRQGGEDVHAEQSGQTIRGAGFTHPTRTLGDLFRRLKQQANAKGQ